MASLLHIIIVFFLVVDPYNGTSHANKRMPTATRQQNNHNKQARQDKSHPKVRTIQAWVTAYSSTVDQTDNTPFETAMGTKVRRGIVATNLLPLGTRIQIPSVFGKKIFTVEDRMHRRKDRHVDIWMPTRKAAKRFGKKRAQIVVLANKNHDKNL